MAEFHPPVGGVHEAALYVGDLRRDERFWRRLGFQVVGRKEGRHVFVRAGRDMLLLFDAAASREGGDVPAHGAEGAGHVALDVPDARALEGWRSHLGEAGVAIEAEGEIGLVLGADLPDQRHGLGFLGEADGDVEVHRRLPACSIAVNSLPGLTGPALKGRSSPGMVAARPGPLKRRWSACCPDLV